MKRFIERIFNNKPKHLSIEPVAGKQKAAPTEKKSNESMEIKLPRINQADETYLNISECILIFNDGRQKKIAKPIDNGRMVVNVVNYKTQAEEFVESVYLHFKDCESIEDLALRCGYPSVKTFYRHFKKHFQTTPKQWMLQMKKHDVLHYLRVTDLTLVEIAERLKFSDASHLHNFCVQQTGLPPAYLRGKKNIV